MTRQRLFGLAGGGWVRVELAEGGEAFSLSLSLPDLEDRNAYGTLLQGMAIPENGRLGETANAILGPEGQVTHRRCGGFYSVLRQETVPASGESEEEDVPGEMVDIYICSRCREETMQPDSPELDAVFEAAAGVNILEENLPE